MKKTLIGEIYHQIEKLGNQEYTHIGFRDPNNQFSETLAKLVP